MRWDEETGATSVYRKPSNYANGNTRDRQGRLVTAEHGRRVTRTEYDGRITVLMDRFDGKRLNSPNDIVVKSDNSIWFTDMNAGITGNWNGEVGEQELPQRVYRIDGKTGHATIATDGLVKRPNGLAFSPDEKKLYVIESEPGARAIYAFDVSDGAKLAQWPQAHRLRQGGDAGRLPRRRRRQPLVRLGHGHGRTRRRAHLQSARRADRPYQPAGARRQRLLWRTQAQSPVHGGVPFDLRALCEHAGRAGWMMAEALPGILAIFNNAAPGREAEFEEWFQHEHLAERIAVPGFLLGRRYEAVSGEPRYFNFYLTQSADVLKSTAYLERLDNPTPMTRLIMSEIFKDMIRTVCHRTLRLGAMRGVAAVTVRFMERWTRRRSRPRSKS